MSFEIHFDGLYKAALVTLGNLLVEDHGDYQVYQRITQADGPLAPPHELNTFWFVAPDGNLRYGPCLERSAPVTQAGKVVLLATAWDRRHPNGVDDEGNDLPQGATT